MRRMHVGIILASALVGLLGAVVVNRLHHHEPAPEPTLFVSADGRSQIEMPGEPTPLAAESGDLMPVSAAVLLNPVPVTTIEVTVGHHSAEPVGDPDDKTPYDLGVTRLLGMYAPAPEKMEGADDGDDAPKEVPAEPASVEVVVPHEPVYPPPVVSVSPVEAPCPPAPCPEVLVAPAICSPAQPWARTYPQNAPAAEAVSPPDAVPGSQASATPEPSTPAETQPAPSAPVVRTVSLPLPELAVAGTHKHVTHGDLLPVTGTYECKLDNQSELNLSANARTELDRPRVIFIALAPDKKCLWVYTSGGVEKLAEQLDHNAANDEMGRCTRRKYFSRLHRVHATSDGLFTLPAELVETAGFKEDLLLIGARDHFELWDAHQWQQYIGQEEPKGNDEKE